AVHTEVGHRTVGARVNGKLVPLDSKLENGDTVEVFTSKAEGAGPSRDWLNFVASPRARNKIKAWFTKERREEAIEAGKAQLARAMRKQNLPLQRLMNHESLTALADDMRLSDVAALYAEIGENHISANTVVSRLVRMVGGDAGAEEDLAEATIPGTATASRARTSDPGIVVEGMDSSDVWVKVARCCTPVPGDPIIGFITRGSGISVHREDCGNVEQLRNEPERIITVAWGKGGAGVFLVQIQIEALDRTGLLSEVTRVLSENHVNILSASSTTSRDRLATLRFTFEMADTEHMGHLLSAIRRIDGVLDSYRVMGNRKRSAEAAQH
ncbi:MAG: ACT domain-containing protein, partial [Actinomycetes bacterium]|nr:ACT domain-containing protein [Actinomycetes bacterium]MDX5381234.1 ACT domain-containing protein [Actinomycetes bacterium]MDX5400544.1 ACT domain-containing protein [Actinomycetes bacterium]MDX5451004.1 ACT domain-containing protein [Actinomycetes bacterium]